MYFYLTYALKNLHVHLLYSSVILCVVISQVLKRLISEAIVLKLNDFYKFFIVLMHRFVNLIDINWFLTKDIIITIHEVIANFFIWRDFNNPLILFMMVVLLEKMGNFLFRNLFMWEKILSKITKENFYLVLWTYIAKKL